jgi:hypothetical protein
VLEIITMNQWTIPPKHPAFDAEPPCLLQGTDLTVHFTTPALDVPDLTGGLAADARKLLTAEGAAALERYQVLRAERDELSKALALFREKLDAAEAKRQELLLGHPGKEWSDQILRQDEEIASMKAELEQTRRRREVDESLLPDSRRDAEVAVDLAARQAATELAGRLRRGRDKVLAALAAVAGTQVNKLAAVLHALHRLGDLSAPRVATNRLLTEAPAAPARGGG